MDAERRDLISHVSFSYTPSFFPEDSLSHLLDMKGLRKLNISIDKDFFDDFLLEGGFSEESELFKTLSRLLDGPVESRLHNCPEFERMLKDAMLKRKGEEEEAESGA
jgi:hypothetical protein